MRRKRKTLSRLLEGILMSSFFLGCQTTNPISGIHQELFRSNSEENRRYLPQLELGGYQIGYENIPETSIKTLHSPTEIQEVTPCKRYILSSNTEYIKKGTDELVVLHKCKIPPEDLEQLLRPDLPEGIEVRRYPGRNMLLFSGKEREFSDFAYFLGLIDQLDRRPEKIRVGVEVIEYFADNTYNREGVLKILQDNSEILGINLPSDPEGKKLEFGISGNPFFKAGGNYDYESLMSFLDSYGKRDILASIDVLAYNGKKVTISNFSRVPYPSVVVDRGTVISVPKFEDTGTAVQVTPFKNSEGDITLKFEKIESGEQMGYSGKEQIPIFRKAQLVGEYVLKNNKTTIALISSFSRYGEVVRGIPLLNSIPILRDITSSRSNDHHKSYLIVLIRATEVPEHSLIDTVRE